MMTKSRLLLLEGVCGAGKTTISRALQKTVGEYEVILLDQGFTYAPIAPAEDAGLLNDELNADALKKQIGYLRNLLNAEHRRPRIVVLDTLHVTQLIRPGVLSMDSFRIVDLALIELGCHMVFLWIDEETLMQRTIVGRRNTGFARYASKFGKSEEQVCAHFYQEQERMWLAANNESGLAVCRLDGSSCVDHLSKSILEFTLSTR